MSDHHDEHVVRLAKLQTLRSLGVKLYPDRFPDKMDIVHIRSLGTSPQPSPDRRGGGSHDAISNPLLPLGGEGQGMRSIESIIQNPRNEIHTAGRIMLLRSFGKLMFGTLQDMTGQIQFALSKEFCMLCQDGEELQETPPTPPYQGGGVNPLSVGCQGRKDGILPPDKGGEQGEGTMGGSSQEKTTITAFKLFEKYVDVGDLIGINGELFVTHKGELTIFVRSFQILSKAMRPLGDKFHGIGEDNQETAYRQRYLDMIFNESSRNRMKFRSDFIRTLREFYWKHDFLEIDCPILTPAASGAAAKPFATHHNDFDRDFYLRICNETELKKATVGGFERVFTLAPVFRNEGSDPSHLQEFYMLEHQNVYKSFHEDMDFTQAMFDHIFENLKLERKFEVKDKEGNPKMVDFTSPWPRIDYVEGVNRASGLDITSYGIDDADRLRSDIRAKGIEFAGMDMMGTMTLIDYLYKKVLRPTITGPAFIYNYPSIIAPLARISDADPRKCEKWQVVVNGWEIINSYGELVDPIRQTENFAEQSKAEEGGDAEATSADMDFVRAMEYGMPIQAGFGMGIERIIAILTQQDNLRDVVMFPLMKPLQANNKEEILNNKETVTAADPHAHITIDLTAIKRALEKYSTTTIEHNRTVGRCMRYFADKSGHNVDYWHAVGMLHDIDWDLVEKDAERHCQEELVRILTEIAAPEGMLEDIRSHYVEKFPEHGFDTLLRKHLASVDELSGFIGACTRMTPNKSLDEVKVTSVLKKLKDKSFAAGIHRDHCRRCETLLGYNLEDFIEEMIEAMKV